MDRSQTFVTSINCIDGRVQKPVMEYLCKKFGVDYVDMVTEPGPNKLLSEKPDSAVANQIVEHIKERVEISVQEHGSKVIALVGHYDCAGNPNLEEMQREQILKGLEEIKRWGFEAEVIGIWVDENFLARESI